MWWLLDLHGHRHHRKCLQRDLNRDQVRAHQTSSLPIKCPLGHVLEEEGVMELAVLKVATAARRTTIACPRMLS